LFVVSVSVVCCQVEVWRRADNSSRGTLPSVVCRECDHEALRTGHDTESGRSTTKKKNYCMRPYWRAPRRAFTGRISSCLVI
jgi:hypothetical protein